MKEQSKKNSDNGNVPWRKLPTFPCTVVDCDVSTEARRELGVGVRPGGGVGVPDALAADEARIVWLYVGGRPENVKSWAYRLLRNQGKVK